MSDVNLDEVLPRFHVMAGSLKAMIEREIKTLTCMTTGPTATLLRTSHLLKIGLTKF